MQLINSAARFLFVSSIFIATGIAAMPAPSKNICNEIRPPAVPLVMVDPYTQVWSRADAINSCVTTHWSGVDHPLVGAVRVDGKLYRVIGDRAPRLQSILPTIAHEQWEAAYVLDTKPTGDWTSRNYDDSDWSKGPGAFGSMDMPGVSTRWTGEGRDIWVRRSFDLEEDIASAVRVLLEYSHDDVFELYVNGVKVVETGNRWRNNVKLDLPEDAKATLKRGRNVVAAHCHNTIGGSYVDFGLFREVSQPSFGEMAKQISCDVLPMRTVCRFECGGVQVETVFTAPLFLDDLDLLSRPVNYLTFNVTPLDGRKHNVQVYFEASPRLAVNENVTPVQSERGSADGIDYVRTGTVSQRIVATRGDFTRCDWGYFYLASPSGKGTLSLSGEDEALSELRRGNHTSGKMSLLTENFVRDPFVMSYMRDLGNVGKEGASDYLLIAYDDLYSLQYFHKNLRPYWNRNGDNTITRELKAASNCYEELAKRVEQFDRELMEQAEKSGGRKYACLCALAYRQAIAAHKLVQAPDGELLFISKELSSNGSAGTVDISYPTDPIFLLYNPVLAEATLNQIYDYVEGGEWKREFAPHDVGGYPQANGQTYGGDMPVEESGNMLIITEAICKVENSAAYAAKHWKALSQWADFLVSKGMDPDNQLCTDDFAGHYAHNANLSVKAITGIACYAELARMQGMNDVADKYRNQALEMAAKWKEMASDGDHYRLTFDRSGTWSQKYNLVWDKVLGLGVFDPEIAATEIAWYLKVQNRYGLPLDSRKTHSKTDWIVWVATMAPDNETFSRLVDPVYDFFNETVDRYPMADLIFTDSQKKAGFYGRSVVGAYFIKMLSDKLSGK